MGEIGKREESQNISEDLASNVDKILEIRRKKMNKLKMQAIILFTGTILLLTGLGSAFGQTVRVYNPNIYDNTRRLISNRVAVRKAVRKAIKKRSISAKKKRHPRLRIN